MKVVFWALFGAAFTVTTATALGAVLLRILALRLCRIETWLFSFLAGSAVLSAILFVLCALKLASRGVFWAIGAAAILAMLRTVRQPDLDGKHLARLPRLWRIAFGAAFAVFAAWYFVVALAPEISPDGSNYHLWLVGVYERAHGFERIPASLFANFPQALELLFLFAFQFGKHSAAALVHLAFLLALPVLIVSYGRRFGLVRAATAAALFTFVCPAVGSDGSSAYVDVALASITFAVFYLLQIWDRDRQTRLLVPVGILAGFSFGVKYTGIIAVLYALCFVTWKLWRAGQPIFRPALLVTGLAMAFVAPWTLKNWLWVGNPVSPIATRWFPNPNVHLSFEEDLSRYMRRLDTGRLANLPLELTLRGGLTGGILGPLFLLSPLALLALRRREGRRVLLAGAIFLIPYFGNIETRFLIPALPFLSLAIALAVESNAPILLALVLASVVTCWPPVVSRYCAPGLWRLEQFPLRAALRMIPEDAWLAKSSTLIAMAQVVEKTVPSNARVFALSASVARAYTSRGVVVRWESASGETTGDIVWAPLQEAFRAPRFLEFHFPPRALRKIRLVQTAATNDSIWSVSELRVYAGGRELERAPNWWLTAQPNPWEVQLAFDNSTITRWRSWQPARPGMFIEIDFAAPTNVDAVRVERPDDEHDIRYRVDGMDKDGNWTTFSSELAQRVVAIDRGLRREAMAQVVQRGFRYFLVAADNVGDDDFYRNAEFWGLKPLVEIGDTRLYRIDVLE